MKSLKIVAMFFAASFFAFQASAQVPTQTAPPTTQATSSTIVDVTGSSKDNSTLLSALKAAGMEETLKGAGPYTFFAPTNDAFGKLPAGKTDALLLPDSKRELNGILYYHVVKGSYDMNALSAAIDKGNGTANLTTVSGAMLKATKENGKIVLSDSKGNKATVNGSEMKASNGVVYSIDNVLIPEAK
jgi:uncharacterized surface protein with fasciclin (FAS1) repeats